MKVLSEDGFSGAPKMVDDIPAWRYAPAESDYEAPAWRKVDNHEPLDWADLTESMEERTLKDWWHEYVMYWACRKWAYDDMVDNIFVCESFGYCLIGWDQLTDDFRDWAMWALRNWLEKAMLDRRPSRWC